MHLRYYVYGSRDRCGAALKGKLHKFLLNGPKYSPLLEPAVLSLLEPVVLSPAQAVHKLLNIVQVSPSFRTSGKSNKTLNTRQRLDCRA